MMNSNSGKNDLFAEIASRRVEMRDHTLEIPQPRKLERKFIELREGKKRLFEPRKKMSTKEELQQELAKMRERFLPFMNNYAPKLEQKREKRFLADFDWRIAKQNDPEDFNRAMQGEGQWERIKVPHYGAPVGRAATFYRTVFEYGRLSEGETLFLCFKGVDYIAHVFVNGAFVGSHEGFFAPFSFDIGRYVRTGSNTLLVKVENDFRYMGNTSSENPDVRLEGEKLYAATGLGYDEPELGWHHCPPGMGIYQDVYLEKRSTIHIHDIFVRSDPDNGTAEVTVEVFNCNVEPVDVTLSLSLYGRNFKETIFENMQYRPGSINYVGLGDSLTEAKERSKGTLHKEIPLLAEAGLNYFKIPIRVENPRIWDLSSPWLYQIQVKLCVNGKTTDCAEKHFGIRSFTMKKDEKFEGAIYLNNRKIKLRGANTMGHEQQCVFKKDWQQLIDDILLAKIANLNFLRLTQRPVQEEVYDYCDMLGLMTQTDLPLFGVMRRNKFCEGLRQVEEMERLVRSHPCNILVSYINEPFPNASNKPHRHLTRDELTGFFNAANIVVRLLNPDRVIKEVDGDYDPPSPGLPDNHCYPCWYNGHGIDIGKLHKGFWQYVKPGWYYGCGEFGAEGLDSVEIMRRHYPAQWLPADAEQEKSWSPSSIPFAQTGKFHYFFYDTPETLEDWVKASQSHQAWAAKIMAEAFRRDHRMVSFAIHLLIDEFPAGWMKAIMDFKRNPKQAYFAYKEALTPLMANIRTDRWKFFAGKQVSLEAWVFNDNDVAYKNYKLQCQIEMNNTILYTGTMITDIKACDSTFCGFINFEAPCVEERTKVKVMLGLADSNGDLVHDTAEEIEIFPACESGAPVFEDHGNTVVIKGSEFQAEKQAIEQYLKDGKKVVVFELPEGEYEFAGSVIKVKACGMLPLHFVSRKTGHEWVEGFKENDFRLWYDAKEDCITPILETTFKAEGFNPVLTSGNQNDENVWERQLAVAEKSFWKGRLVICQLKLQDRVEHNPVARAFAVRLLS